MYLRLLFVISLLLPISAAANELVELQSDTIAAQIEINPFVDNLVRQGLVGCPTGGDSDEEAGLFVGCMNAYVFTQVGRWGICAKRFPQMDARVIQPCLDDQKRAQQLALASVTHVQPDEFNRCASLSLYEPSEEAITAFYLELGKQMIKSKFSTSAANSFVLSLGPFDSEQMLTCLANLPERAN